MQVKIKNYKTYPEYEGKIGEVVDSSDPRIWDVKMEDGIIISPWNPSSSNPQCEIIETKLVVGNKYVPLKKSTCGDLSGSAAWNTAKKRNQPFLYLTRIDTDCLVLNEDNNSTGDFFLEEDVIPYEEEFVLPKEWCIKVTEKNEKVIREWYNASYDIVGKWFKGQLNEFYSWSSSNDWSQKGSLPELTLEQFKKHILKQTEMKIIGYKLKEDCQQYESAVRELTGYKSLSINETQIKPATNGKSSTDLYDVLVEAKVLDLWFEPVYEEEFKVGDWATVTGIGSYHHGRSSGDDEPVIGGVYLIREVTSRGINLTSPDGFINIGNIDLRKATSSEIKEAQSIVIEGYKLEKNSDGSITFGCQDFSKETVAALKDLFSRTSFKFSCKVNNTEITKEILRKL
jgi:hypothetical protein